MFSSLDLAVTKYSPDVTKPFLSFASAQSPCALHVFATPSITSFNFEAFWISTLTAFISVLNFISPLSNFSWSSTNTLKRMFGSFGFALVSRSTPTYASNVWYPRSAMLYTISDFAWLPIPFANVCSSSPFHNVIVFCPQLLSFVVGFLLSPDVCDSQSRSDKYTSPLAFNAISYVFVSFSSGETTFTRIWFSPSCTWNSFSILPTPLVSTWSPRETWRSASFSSAFTIRFTVSAEVVPVYFTVSGVNRSFRRTLSPNSRTSRFALSVFGTFRFNV